MSNRGVEHTLGGSIVEQSHFSDVSRMHDGFCESSTDKEGGDPVKTAEP